MCSFSEPVFHIHLIWLHQSLEVAGLCSEWKTHFFIFALTSKTRQRNSDCGLMNIAYRRSFRVMCTSGLCCFKDQRWFVSVTCRSGCFLADISPSFVYFCFKNVSFRQNEYLQKILHSRGFNDGPTSTRGPQTWANSKCASSLVPSAHLCC